MSLVRQEQAVVALVVLVVLVVVAEKVEQRL